MPSPPARRTSPRQSSAPAAGEASPDSSPFAPKVVSRRPLGRSRAATTTAEVGADHPPTARIAPVPVTLTAGACPWSGPSTTRPPLPNAPSRRPAAVMRTTAAATSPGNATVVARQMPSTILPRRSIATAWVLANVTPAIGTCRNPPAAKAASGRPLSVIRATTAIRPRLVPNGGAPSTAPARTMLGPATATDFHPPGRPPYAPLAISSPPPAKSGSSVPSANRRATAGTASSTSPATTMRPCASSAMASARVVA